LVATKNATSLKKNFQICSDILLDAEPLKTGTMLEYIFLFESSQAWTACPFVKKNAGTGIEHWWNGTDRVKHKYSERKVSQCHFVHHKSHMDCCGIGPLASATFCTELYVRKVYVLPALSSTSRRSAC